MLRRTPPMARLYLLVAALLLALPGAGRLYEGTTGKLLVATYGIDREPFRRSVVYVVHHDFFGAYGFILNKPSQGEVSGIGEETIPRWLGGPVRPQEPSFVMGREKEGAGLWMFPRHGESEEDPELFSKAQETIAQGVTNLRGMFGYAGWTVFQVDWEIFRGRWAVIDFDPALVFDTPPEEMWGKALERARADRQNGIDTDGEPI